MAVHSLHTSSAVISGISGYVPNIKSGNLSMDTSREPYISGSITIVAPDSNTVELISPLSGQRVTVTVVESFGTGTEWNPVARPAISRTFDLFLISRAMNKKTFELTLELSSDETLLQLYKHPVSGVERTYGLSVKTAVTLALAKIGAVLTMGAEDGNLTSNVLGPTLTNLITNPSAEVNTTGWLVDAYRAMTRVIHAAGGIPGITNEGSYFARLTFGGYSGGLATSGPFFTNGFTAIAGITYAGSVWLRSSRVQRIQPAIQWNVGGQSLGTPIVLTPNVWTLVTFSFTAPIGATNGGPYFYSVAGDGYVGWQPGDTVDVDCLIVVADSKVPVYFDGTSENPGLSTNAWSGTAHASTSTRTWLPVSDATIWQPGTSASDWIEPMLQQSGLHLWCDETRQWRLKADRSLPDLLQISAATSLTEAMDTIDLAKDSTYYDHVTLAFKGNIAPGVNGAPDSVYTNYDTATSGTYLAGLYLEYETARPGIGGAANILANSLGKGRVFALTAVSNYEATPGQNLIASLPDTPIQSGVVQAVKWDLGALTMDITSSGLTKTPGNAWVLAIGPWTAATGSWLAATGTN